MNIIKSYIDNKDMLGWKLKHPEHWGSSEVLDWVYFVAKTYEWNGSIFRGERFNKLTGPALIRMSKDDFLKCDENYGDVLHQCFFKLLKEATFHRPELLSQGPSLNDISDLELDMTINPDYHYIDGKDVMPFPDPIPGQIKMYACMYEFDRSERFQGILDDGYDSAGSSTSERSRNSSLSSAEDSNLQYTYPTTQHHQPHQLQQQQQQQQQQQYYYGTKTPEMNGISAQPDSWSMVPQPKPAKRPPGRPRKIRPPGEEGKPYTPSQRGRKPGQTAKGNHLWEFIRDLLKDPEANPKLIRWEEPYNMGIFRIMESDTVAKMWGKKKNNPKMDYPKLSRAIRFCRTAGYFMGVPKDGRYPKKLCFRFGAKAFGWQDLQKHCPPQNTVMTS